MSSRIGTRALKRRHRANALGIVAGRYYSQADLQRKLGIVRPPHDLRQCDRCGDVSVIELDARGRRRITKVVTPSGLVKFEASAPEAGRLIKRAWD